MVSRSNFSLILLPLTRLSQIQTLSLAGTIATSFVRCICLALNRSMAILPVISRSQVAVGVASVLRGSSSTAERVLTQLLTLHQMDVRLVQPAPLHKQKSAAFPGGRGNHIVIGQVVRRAWRSFSQPVPLGYLPRIISGAFFIFVSAVANADPYDCFDVESNPGERITGLCWPSPQIACRNVRGSVCPDTMTGITGATTTTIWFCEAGTYIDATTCHVVGQRESARGPGEVVAATILDLTASCAGTEQFDYSDQLCKEPTELELLNQETFEAFYPWALLMLATGFGIRTIRRLIISRG